MSTPIVAISGMNRGENPQPGYAVGCSLRRAFPEIQIVGLIYDAMESGIYADDGPDWAYTIPYPTAGAKALLERLDFILKKHRIEILIPCLDAEIELFIHLQPELEARGIRSFLPTLGSFHARAKPVLDKLCRVCDCVTPAIELACDLNEAKHAAENFGYPVMIKGQFYDARKVLNETELARAFHETIRDWGVPVLVQRCIEGNEFNVLGVGDGKGRSTGFCTVRKTILSSKGKGISAVVLREPRLIELSERIIAHLQWRGPFELEFIYDADSETFQLIEMNPRFPAWVDFPAALGLNFPAQVLSLIRGERLPRSPEVPAGRFFLRHQVEMIGSMEELGQLMTEGAWQCRRIPS